MLDKYDKLSLNPFTHVTHGLRLEKSEDHPDIQEHSWGVHAGCRICAKGPVVFVPTIGPTFWRCLVEIQP